MIIRSLNSVSFYTNFVFFSRICVSLAVWLPFPTLSLSSPPTPLFTLVQAYSALLTVLAWVQETCYPGAACVTSALFDPGSTPFRNAARRLENTPVKHHLSSITRWCQALPRILRSVRETAVPRATRWSGSWARGYYACQCRQPVAVVTPLPGEK